MARIGSSTRQPDLSDLQSQYITYATKRYSELRERQKWHEDLYWQKAKIYLEGPEFAHPTYPPNPMRIVEAPADSIAMDYITVNQPPRLKGPSGAETEKAKKEADSNGKWCQRLIDYWRLQEPYFLRELIKNYSYRGEGYAAVDINRAWLRDPETAKGPPFTLEVPDSINIYASLELNNCLPREVFREKIVEVAHIKRLLEAWNPSQQGRTVLGLSSLRDSDLVYLIEWWTEEWHGYFAAQHNVQRTLIDVIPIAGELFLPNDLGFVPYLRGFSGLGMWPHDGTPASLAVGMLTNIERILIRDARNATMIDTMTAKYTLPPPVAKLSDGYELQKGTDDKFEAGTIKETRSDRVLEWSYLNPPPIPAHVLQERAVLDNILNNYLPPVLSGVPVPGEPASSMVARYGWASLRWEPMRISAKRLISRACELVLQMIDTVIKESVEIDNFSIGPEEIKGYYRIDVDIKPGNPEQLRYDYLQGLQLWGKWPRRMIVEKFFHEADATQFLLDLDADELWEREKANPVFLNNWAGEVFAELGREKEVERLAEEAEAIPPGVPGAEGEETPGIPTRGEQLPGMGGSPTRGIAGMAGARMPEGEAITRLRRMLG